MVHPPDAAYRGRYNELELRRAGLSAPARGAGMGRRGWGLVSHPGAKDHRAYTQKLTSSHKSSTLVEEGGKGGDYMGATGSNEAPQTQATEAHTHTQIERGREGGKDKRVETGEV